MRAEDLRIGQIVCYAIDPNKTGIVTAIVQRLSITAAVTWSHTLDEKSHMPIELELVEESKDPIGFRQHGHI
jgi:hypothetical protein